LEQLTFLWEELPVNPSQLRDSEKALKTQEEISPSSIVEYLTALSPSGLSGKTYLASSVQMEEGILVPSSGRWRNSGMGSATECLTLNTSEWPKDAAVCSLSEVLEVGGIAQKFFLSPLACRGILRRAEKRGKELPKVLLEALTLVAHSKPETTKIQEQTGSTEHQAS